MTSIAARLRELPGPAGIVLVILGFLLWWPLGIAILAYLIWSKKMACCGFGFGRANAGVESTVHTWTSGKYGSGNHAFDEYRAETLRRLEDEQREFADFLRHLRMAKDKAEFDQFMTERRSRAQAPAPQPQSA